MNGKKAIHFGTDGWRAIIAREFTFENVAKVILAIGDYLKEKSLETRPVVIGYDNRFLAENFGQLAAEIFSSQGFKVLLCDINSPTPVVAFAVVAQKAGGAVMFTASHNPPEYQGIKFIPEYAGPASAEITGTIEKNLEKFAKALPSYIPRPDRIQKFNPKPAYYKQLHKLIDFKLLASRKFKVVYDPMFGVGKNYLDELMAKAGYQVEVINGQRDPLFGGILPEPKEATLKELMKKTVRAKANLGIANDGDADRYGIVDEKGNFISPDAVGSLLFYYLAKEKKIKGSAVKTVATTHTMDKIAQKLGVKIYTTPVGFKYLAKIMLREPVIIGCEQSSGLSIKGHIPEKDGILAGLLVLEMLAYYKKPLSIILKNLIKEFGAFYNDSFNLEISREKIKIIIENLKNTPPQKLAGAGLKEVITLDGVKLVYDDSSWFLVRPSGTEPLVRLYLEAPSEPKLNQLKRAVGNLFKKF